MALVPRGMGSPACPQSTGRTLCPVKPHASGCTDTVAVVRQLTGQLTCTRPNLGWCTWSHSPTVAATVAVACIGLVGSRTEPSESAIALLEGLDGRPQMLTTPIRPEGVVKDEFGIGRLPDQEIGGAVLATGSN